ncbi:MAG: hypothetical protein JWQ19_2361 [Subtercola sp.]|nr:hypothetical protein [Subtercola sp.]
MQFPGTKLFPVADWEHALKGDPMLADVLDVREEVEFLVSEFDRLVDFPPIELNDRLADYAEQYRLKMLG